MGALGIAFNRRTRTKDEQPSLFMSGWGPSWASLKHIREWGKNKVGSDNVSAEGFFSR